jgi:hypothetical protein
MAFATFSPTKGYASFSTLVFPQVTPTAVTVTTATTPVAVTAAQVLNGFLIVDCQDTGTITLPTAAALKAAINGCQAYTAFKLEIRNSGDTTLTVAGGTGGTISGTATLATVTAKAFLVVFTATAEGSEAYTAYSLGAATY